MTVRAVSYGGGVQSTALLVLAAERQINFDLFLFANVGDDSEHPDSLRYVREVAMPYAATHGIELLELTKQPSKGRFAGETETLWKRLTHPDSKSLGFPIRMSGGKPSSRSCTADFKVGVVSREIKRRGASPRDPAVVAIGISVDEIERAKPGSDPRQPSQTVVYPLLDLGLHRRDCRRVIADGGLPVPPKSSCFFCPYHSISAWRDLRNNRPDLWEKAVELETHVSLRSQGQGHGPMFMTDRLVPLPDAVDDQLGFDGMGDDCDSGWCMT
jgi:PP-loop superfamily ATP-utilizing enzyme